MDTLEEARNAGIAIEVRCQQPSRVGTTKIGRCQNISTLDMETLIATRGHGFPLAMLQSRLKCPSCGSRKIVVVFRGGKWGGAAAAIG